MGNFEQIISELNVEIVIQIIIAIGVIFVFRILSSVVSSIIIKMLRPKGNDKVSVKKNPFYLPLRTIFKFVGIYIALNIISFHKLLYMQFPLIKLSFYYLLKVFCQTFRLLIQL